MMVKPFPRLLAVGLAAAAAVTALTPPFPAHALATQRAATVAASPATAILLNGDRLVPAGPHAFGVIRAWSGFAAATEDIGSAGHTLDVPAAALPYLGRGLDPSLFDVAKLPRTGRLPVAISYQGSDGPVLPGVTLTGTRAGTATGYLTAQSAKVFYAALLRQFRTDHATGAYGADGMFANGTAIRLAGTSAPARTHRPAFPMHTLTVKGTAPDGTPDTGDYVLVLNMDSFERFAAPADSLNPFYRGTTKFSLPSGHYLAVAVFFGLDSHGNPVSEHLVINPSLTVTGDTTITADARTARSLVTFKTPKPAKPLEIDWTLYVTDSTGHVFSVDYQAGQNTATYVNETTRRPAAGSLRVLAAGVLTSPSTASSPYRYDLSFLNSSGTIGSQTYTAPQTSLATITSRYFADAAHTGALCRYSIYRFTAFGNSVCGLYPIPVPFQRAEYVSAGSPAVYYGSIYAPDLSTLDGEMSDAMRTYPPGQQTAEDWNAYPLHPVLGASVLGTSDVYPTMLSAVRTVDALTFDIYPYGDNTPGHTGAGFFPGTGTYELDRNGVRIAGGYAAAHLQFFKKLTVSPAPSTYRLTLAASRSPGLSPRTTTVWTWRSAHESGRTLPRAWVCPTMTYPLTRNCTSQSLMTLRYKVAGLALNGVAPAGAQVVGIAAGHQQLAAAAAVAAVSASFSADGGTSWKPASVKGSGARWAASFSAPAGSKVSLKVTATDKNGGAISETVLNAYAVSSSPASAGYRPAPCSAAKAGRFACDLLYSPQTTANRAAESGIQAALAGPAGWGATAIEKAYRLPVSRKGGTVAVVDAYDTPKLETYLNVYRKQYGLAPCTTANGCFRKVNERGLSSPLPSSGTGSGWDAETTLDVDMISAACPQCHILVVEGNSPALEDFATAENSAVRLGAAAVSNSYGTRESGYTQAAAAAYHHPGHAIVASAGDAGYTAASFPANLASVTAVGGTQMSSASSPRGYTETVWNTPSGPATRGGAGGSGCSAYVPKPAWQHDTHCQDRTVADVSAVAWDIPIYNTDWAKGGWLSVGGTSASSPLIAAIYALAGNTATVMPGYEYAHSGAFYDISAGNNDWWFGTGGNACGHDYLCVASKGYDAPTGLGTPNGIAGF